MAITMLAAWVLAVTARGDAQECTWDGTPSVDPPVVTPLRSVRSLVQAPGRLAVSSGGDLYVSDPRAGRVVRVDVHGTVLSVRRGLRSPLAVAVDDGGIVYVGEHWLGPAGEDVGSVTMFDPGWNIVGHLGQGAGEFVNPTDMAIDPDPTHGSIYVADGGAHVVGVYSLAGPQTAVFGGHGTALGEMDFPAAVHVTAVGEVVVGDQNNDRVQVFDRSATLLRCFGSSGGTFMRRKFGRIQGITSDAIGRLYVSDAFQGSVWVFDPLGVPVHSIGSLGSAPGQLRSPVGLVIDPSSRLFVSSHNSGRLEVVGLDGFVDPPELVPVFADRFETGDLSAWSQFTP
jgi:sugar lactone lactonase YvrE